MRLSNRTWIALIGASLLFAAGPALADVTAPPPSAARPDAPAAAPDAGPASPDTTQVITGRVLDLDIDAGKLVLQTERGVVALQGPSEALQGLNVGDLVQVLVPSDEVPPSASPREEDVTPDNAPNGKVAPGDRTPDVGPREDGVVPDRSTGHPVEE